MSHRWIATGILGVALVLAFLSSVGDSLVVDEVPHIGAGYSYVTKLDDRLNPEHPPLIKTLAGLTLLPLHFDQAVFQIPQWETEVNSQWTFGRQLIFHSGVNADIVKNLARLPALLIFALGGFLVWHWSRQRSGAVGGVLAITLWAFSPTLLAHGRLVTTDMVAAVGVLAATYFFLRFLRASTLRTFCIASSILGLALLAKFNTVLLGPFFLLVALMYGWGSWRSITRRVGLTALIGIAALVFVVWPVYAIQTAHYPMERQISDTQKLLAYQKDGVLKSLVSGAVQIAPLRPLAHWGLGLSMAVTRQAGDNTIYWLGKVVKTGGPLYFPIVYFLKEPLAWWGLVIIAVITKIMTRVESRKLKVERMEAWTMMLWIAIYTIVSIRSPLNIGVRHLLPIYPFAIILVAGAVTRIRTRFWVGLVAVLVGWYVAESVRVFPSYLTYFNQIALLRPSWASDGQAGFVRGGHNYVVDSNVDWGQDLKRLGQWVTQENIPKICLDYFGWADPAYYLDGRSVWTSSTRWSGKIDFLQRNQCNGWIAISATFFQNSVGERTFPDPRAGSYRWLLNDQPIAVIGNSIFVWHLK